MMPSLTYLTPWQPPSTPTMSDALLLAGRLQRGVAAVSGGLVDGVDEVDLVGLLQDVLHRLAAALGRALGHVGADDLRASRSAQKCFLSFTAMPKPVRKPLWRR